MNCENILRPFGNIVNYLLGQDNYEKFAMEWFYFKMRINFTNENIKYLKNVIHDGDFCFDIGANRGEISYYISRLVGNNGKVISIEPVSKARKLLDETIIKFGLKNVIICPVALSNEAGKFDMFIPKVNGVHIFALANLEKNHDQSKAGYYEEVKVNTLDNIVDKYSPKSISFIKCDVEGHELEVFKGGIKTLEKYKPTILVEIWEQKQRVVDEKITSDLIEFLEGYGYVCMVIINGGLRILNAKLIREKKIQDFLFIYK